MACTRRKFLAVSTLATLSFLTVSQAKFHQDRAIYLPGWNVVSEERIDKQIDLLKQLSFNTIMFDVKNAHGELFFSPDQAAAAPAQVRSVDGHPRSILFDYLRTRADEENIRLVARYVVFRDKFLYRAQPDSQLHKMGSEFWVNAQDERVLEYNSQLLAQLDELGLDEIALDYIRFPAAAGFGSNQEKNMAITSAVSHFRSTLSTNLGVQLFGIAAWESKRAGVGQDYAALDDYVDSIYPMIYPSHFAKGSFGYADPNKHVYDFIEMATQAATRQVPLAKIHPMIQAFWYSPQQIADQIKATVDLSTPGFACWNPSANYEKLKQALNL